MCILCESKETSILYKKKGFDIAKCKCCGLIFTILPENYNTDKIYDQTYFNGDQKDGYSNYIASERIIKLQFSKTLKYLLQKYPPTTYKRLLEIGSAYGFFLDIVAPHYESIGIEVAETCVAFSQKRGHNVICGKVTTNLINSLGYFDIITLFDVIEHLENPKVVVEILYHALNKNGVLILTTGDISSLYAKLSRKRWRLLTPPQHLFFFSRKNIIILLENVGFKEIKIYYEWKKVPLSLVLFQLFERINIKIPKKILNKLNNKYFPINLYDAMKITAIK